VDFDLAVVVNQAQFSKFVHKIAHAGARRTDHSASVSWLTLAMIGSGRPSLPK
jgi:hypothetical protein